MKIWKNIDGYDKYEISSFGNVRNKKSGRILKQMKHNGYLVVGLCNKEKGKRFRVHRLVAFAFIPNPQNKTDVNHIDENRCNNHAENLEWLSHRENCNFGTYKERLSESMKKIKSFKKPIIAIFPNGDKKEFPSAKACSDELGIYRSGICRAASGILKTAGGLKFEYKEEA